MLDGETMPYVDVTAATMLAQVSDDVKRSGVRLIFARDIGQVRDILGIAEPETMIDVFDSVADDVAAVEQSPPVSTAADRLDDQ